MSRAGKIMAFCFFISLHVCRFYYRKSGVWIALSFYFYILSEYLPPKNVIAGAPQHIMSSIGSYQSRTEGPAYSYNVVGSDNHIV